MKNIHILPTDKPSRLFEIIQFNLSFDKENYFSEEYKKLHKYKNKNIYITSDSEDIDINDYIITKDGRLVQVSYLLSKDLEGASKVVLTTDQDLIKDGVWGIEDGFVEWFVKNPTCEYVELKGYAIILPGESCDCDIMCSACKEEVIDGLTMGQIQCKDCNDNLTDCTCIEDTVDMKQETREYDLLQHIKFCLECKNESQAIRLIEKYGFQKQEEIYSEEDMREAIMFGANGMYGWQMGEEGYTDNQIKRFLKTFKKK